MKQKPALALSHGSRTQLVVAELLGIPSLTIYDYEFTQELVVFNPTYTMTPEIIPDSSIKLHRDRVTKYPGIKEDVYVSSYIPDPSIKTDLKMDDKKVIVTIRPPATEAHYFCKDSEEMFEAAMKFLLQKEEIQLILIPRNKKQEDFVREMWPDAFSTKKMIIPDHAINGLDLMWFSDLVISGGGTMNREAAALGVPVYSIFRGTIGAVDNYLSEKGRLVLLESPNDLGTKIKLIKRDKNFSPDQSEKKALNTIVNKIVEILQK
jgi:predicted glycosyltransferase